MPVLFPASVDQGHLEERKKDISIFFFSIKLDSLLLPQVFFTVSWQQHIHFNMALFLRQGLPKCLLISEGKLILQEGINSSPHFPPI